MKIYESSENYLETILILTQEKGYVRSIDIANEMGFSKPSVSVAMKNLREKDLITVDDGGYIKLTPRGLEIAEDIYEKHRVIAGIFMDLGVSEEIAFSDACKIEHDISEETFRCLKAYYMREKGD